MTASSEATRPASRRRRWAARGAGALLAGVLAATLLGFLGALDWRLDLFSHFRVQYAAGSAMLLIGGSLVRLRRLLLAAAAALVVVNVLSVAPWLFGREPSLAGSGEPLRVALWNTWRKNHDAEEVLAFVRESACDVVILQETTPAVRERIGELEGDYRIVVVRDDVALVSRALPDATAREMPLPGGRGIEIGTRLLGAPVTILSAHLPAPFNARYAAARAEMLSSIARRVAARPVGTVLIGDLNTTPWSAEMRRFVEAAGLRDSLRGRGLQPTFPFHNALTPVLAIPIDHCLTTADLVVTERRVGDSRSSNHRPLFTEIRR